MRNRKQPSFPGWILQRIGNTGNDSVTGDIVEEYANGRSKTWFWKQVFAVLVRRLLTVTRNHPLLVVGCLVVGHVTWNLGIYGGFAVVTHVHHRYPDWPVWWP